MIRLHDKEVAEAAIYEELTVAAIAAGAAASEANTTTGKVVDGFICDECETPFGNPVYWSSS